MELNAQILSMKQRGVLDTNEISDGYHTFGELYRHRNELFIALCLQLFRDPCAPEVWRSETHSDGSTDEGWFLLGIGTEKGKQITYHLPISYWDKCAFAAIYSQAPEYDGHTSADVLQRLKNLL